MAEECGGEALDPMMPVDGSKAEEDNSSFAYEKEIYKKDAYFETDELVPTIKSEPSDFEQDSFSVPTYQEQVCVKQEMSTLLNVNYDKVNEDITYPSTSSSSVVDKNQFLLEHSMVDFNTENSEYQDCAHSSHQSSFSSSHDFNGGFPEQCNDNCYSDFRDFNQKLTRHRWLIKKKKKPQKKKKPKLCEKYQNKATVVKPMSNKDVMQFLQTNYSEFDEATTLLNGHVLQRYFFNGSRPTATARDLQQQFNLKFTITILAGRLGMLKRRYFSLILRSNIDWHSFLDEPFNLTEPREYGKYEYGKSLLPSAESESQSAQAEELMEGSTENMQEPPAKFLKNDCPKFLDFRTNNVEFMKHFQQTNRKSTYQEQVSVKQETSSSSNVNCNVSEDTNYPSNSNSYSSDIVGGNSQILLEHLMANVKTEMNKYQDVAHPSHPSSFSSPHEFYGSFPEQYDDNCNSDYRRFKPKTTRRRWLIKKKKKPQKKKKPNPFEKYRTKATVAESMSKKDVMQFLQTNYANSDKATTLLNGHVLQRYFFNGSRPTATARDLKQQFNLQFTITILGGRLGVLKRRYFSLIMRSNIDWQSFLDEPFNLTEPREKRKHGYGKSYLPFTKSESESTQAEELMEDSTQNMPAKFLMNDCSKCPDVQSNNEELLKQIEQIKKESKKRRKENQLLREENEKLKTLISPEKIQDLELAGNTQPELVCVDETITTFSLDTPVNKKVAEKGIPLARDHSVSSYEQSPFSPAHAEFFPILPHF